MQMARLEAVPFPSPFTRRRVVSRLVLHPFTIFLAPASHTEMDLLK
jgi:hypothetical protein